MKTATKKTTINTAILLELMGACRTAMEWADAKPAKDVWETCDRGNWLLWISARVGVDRKLVVLAACDCAEKSLKFVPPGENRPRKAIEAARAWTRGRATIAEVRAAYASASAARSSTRKECADAVRARIPWSVVSAAALEKLS